MRDIRKRYHNSKSNNEIKIVRSNRNISDEFDNKFLDRRNISEKAEMFEKGEYQDISYTREGKPIMKASSHFDLKNSISKKRKRDDFDVLKRGEFFNSKKRDFDEEDIKIYKKAKNKKNKRKKVFWYSIFIILILGFLSLTFIFDKATININPKYKDIDISDQFLFFKDDILVDIASTTLSKTILRSEPKEVNQKAQGEITIYNNYSDAPQVLIKNTRFQTEDGKIFRISDSITVPGKNGNNPGTIKIKVSADTYGKEYNIGPTDFKIPGFKGTARYDAFYAKSDTQMSGGASGIVQIVSEADIENANSELKPKLVSDLSSITNNIIHDGYYTLYGVPIITFSDNSNILPTAEDNTYYLSGFSTIFSIKKDILAKMIAKQALKDEYNEQDLVRLENIDNLSFSLAEDTDSNSNILKVKIEGKVRIVWTYSDNELKNDLVGQKVKNFTKILEKYNYAILDVTYSTNPNWMNSFPDSLNKIKIIEEIK